MSNNTITKKEHEVVINEEVKKESKVKKLFGFFKLSKAKRLHVQEPKDRITWVKHGFSEFIGSVLIALMFAGLTTYIDGKEFVERYLISPILVGFYGGFIAVGSCLIMFVRWSCDLNPAVTLCRYLNGTNTGRYAAFKILIQFTAGIFASFLIFGSGSTFNPAGLSNQPIDALKASSAAFGYKEALLAGEVSAQSAIAAGGSWIFFTELVATSILLFPIFSPNIKDKYRDLMICFVISMSIWMGIFGGSPTLNAARGMAQQLPILIFANHFESFANVTANSGIATSSTNINFYSVQVGTICMFLGTFLAPFLYLFTQGLSRTFVNPMFLSMIYYKNHKASSMHYVNQK